MGRRFHRLESRRFETSPTTLPDTAGELRPPRILILAGGDGVRLRRRVPELIGDNSPNQFAAITGGESLARTWRRAALLAAPEHVRIVLTRRQSSFYTEALKDAPATSLLIQPDDRGTATAVLYALLRDARLRSSGPVVVLPSDHWVSDDAVFMAHVVVATAAVESHPDLIVLLGIAPTRPETDYCWIEPWEPILEQSANLRAVRSIVEKPAPGMARFLQSQGFLWNSLVVVGHVQSLLLLIASALPRLVNAFCPIWNELRSPSEDAALERLYRYLPDADFSRDVLATLPEMLSVLPVTGVLWETLGDPEPVHAIQEESTSSESDEAAPWNAMYANADWERQLCARI